MATFPLGRKVPTDWEHVRKYPISALSGPALEEVKGAPGVLGVNWYGNFDTPIKKGTKWWIGLVPSLGRLRGGHAIAVQSKHHPDASNWYKFYTQEAGSCVGFSCSRAMSMFNRKLYDPYWLWDRAKEIDDWAETNPGDGEGTSVRAAMDVLRTTGHVYKSPRSHLTPWNDWQSRKQECPDPNEGIFANRWALSVDELLEFLDSGYEDGIPLVNSWGTAYPRRVWMPLNTLDRLIREDGEVALITDR